MSPLILGSAGLISLSLQKHFAGVVREQVLCDLKQCRASAKKDISVN